MDDERIRKLTQEVLAAVGGAREERVATAGLEARVERLEAVVQQLQGHPIVAQAASPAPAGRAVSHPSLRLLDVPGGDDRCILEPDKPCEKSGRCRSFGF